MPTSLARLQRHFAGSPSELISDKTTIVGLLQDCWESLEGHDAEAMAAYKLDRIESLKWEPPNLSFVIERHGGTVMSSTRADLHEWKINVDEGKASCNP